jgi:hypothetical protein
LAVLVARFAKDAKEVFVNFPSSASLVCLGAGSFLGVAERARSEVAITASPQPRIQPTGHAPGEGLRPQLQADFPASGVQFDPSRDDTYPFRECTPDESVQIGGQDWAAGGSNE